MSVAAFRSIIDAAATRHALDPRVICGQIQVESGGNQVAIRFEPGYRYFWDVKNDKPFRHLDQSELLRRRAPSDFYGFEGNHEQEWALQSCSLGLGQLMGAVVRELGWSGVFLTELLLDPALNIEYQCRKLSADLKWAKGDIRSALASYNGGRVQNAPGAPLRNEAYVQKVEKAMRFFL